MRPGSSHSSSPGAFHVSWARSLASEKFLSMDLYAADLAAGFQGLENAPECRFLEFDTPVDVPRWRRFLARRFVYPRWAAKAGKDPRNILHVLDHSTGHLCRYHPRSVATCHDIAEYRISQLSGRQLNSWKWRVEGMRSARHVIAISQNTAFDLKELLGIPAERISVVHYGVSDIFRPRRSPEDAALFPALAGRGLKILHVGSNILRKNMTVLVEGLRLLKEAGVDFTFVKVGQEFPPPLAAQITEAGLDGRILHLGNRKTEDLPVIYSMCDVFVFPSTYEGFGRPILEAQACGTAVVLSDSSCMAEVGGDKALYFPAADPAALRDRLLALTDPEARRRAGESGLVNAARFTWEAHAAGVAEVYRRVAAETVPGA